MEVCCFSVHKNNFKKCFVAKLQFILLTFLKKGCLLCTLEALLEFRQQASCSLLKLGSCARKPQPRCWKRIKTTVFLGGRKACIKEKKHVILCWGHGNSHLLDEIPCLSCLKEFILDGKSQIEVRFNSQYDSKSLTTPQNACKLEDLYIMIHHDKHGPNLTISGVPSVESPHAERSDPSKTDTAKVSRSCATEPQKKVETESWLVVVGGPLLGISRAIWLHW